MFPGDKWEHAHGLHEFRWGVGLAVRLEVPDGFKEDGSVVTWAWILKSVMVD